MTGNDIRKQILLRATRERVWEAIADSSRFGTWFGMAFDGPFVEGEWVTGHIVPTKVDSEVAKLQEPASGMSTAMFIETIQPRTKFAFRWHPYAIEEGVDYTGEPTTLVTFELGTAENGVLLTITESGFDNIPIERRAAAFEANDGGWSHQANLIAKYLAGGWYLTVASAVHSTPAALQTSTAAPVFSALGDPVRLSIVAHLCEDGPLPTIDLTRDAGLSRQAITKHLQILERAGILRSERVGRDRQWRVDASRLARTREFLDVIAGEWDRRLERLRAFVEMPREGERGPPD